VPEHLNAIRGPGDLRRLSYDELDDLSAEIRHFIVQAVAANAGHLGSNLGAVELTLALHRVFHSPDDIILWDTGHQAYVHKILTGRRDDFARLRQPGGLSGYPSRAESEHDWVETSHASTSPSYAFGLSVALDQAAVHDRQVVAVLGDGAMTGGMAYEALNNLGHSGRKAVIVFNDNGRSYAPTVSRISESVARLRLHPSYLRQRARVSRLVRDVPVVGDHLAWGLEGALTGLRDMIEPTAFFETLGLRYSGPFDGHDVEGLERALRNAADYDDGPVVVHVLTQKGRGYPPAEDDEEKCLHDAPRFNPEIGPQHVPGGPPSYTGAFTEVLIKEAEAHPELVAITAAMPGSTGLIAFGERFGDRLIDVGIAEQHAVTSASGMAMGGLRPVVAIYSTFLTRAFDQCMFDVGLHGQPVIFAVDRAGVTGPDGASAQGVLDMVLLPKIPGMTMFAPSSYQELQQMFRDAMDITTGPVAIRWPRTPAPMVDELEVGCGLAGRRVSADEDARVCLVGVGKMLADVEQAAIQLRAQGIGCTVWDPRVVQPFDPALVADAARHEVVVTIEDGMAEGGVGNRLAALVGDAAVDAGAAHPPWVVNLGTPREFLAHGLPEQILADLGLDADGIVAAVTSRLR
jgi:1-deoxy-D-xylulose-5-phosphate synthase